MCLQTRGISFSYIMNSTGPNIEPCGTPKTIPSLPDDTLCNFTRCIRPFEQDLNQLRELLLIP